MCNTPSYEERPKQRVSSLVDNSMIKKANLVDKHNVAEKKVDNKKWEKQRRHDRIHHTN